VEIAAAASTLLSSLDHELHAHLCKNFQNKNTRHVIGDNSGLRGLEQLFREMIDMCFVSLLTFSALNFVWDRCFLFGWRDVIPAMVCCDVILMNKKVLVNFHGDKFDCMRLLQGNKHEILTSSLMERFEYYSGKDLIPEMDMSAFDNNYDNNNGNAVEESPTEKGNLHLLFKFSDVEYKAERIDFETEVSERSVTAKDGCHQISLLNFLCSAQESYKRKLVDSMIDHVLDNCMLKLGQIESASKLKAAFRGKKVRRALKVREGSCCAERAKRIRLA